MAKNYALLPEPVTMYTQTEALKEAKDLSQNLVSGDFERDYRGGVMENSGQRQKRCMMGLAVAVGALAACMILLAVSREVEIANLRHEVKQLSANVFAMTAIVNSLNQKVSSNRLFNEFKTLEDTIYADGDQDASILVDDEKDKGKDNPLHKLHDLTTVLEDDTDADMADDEDMYDTDSESGDWYLDYDRRREKIGTTNMMKLKPEDFTGSVVTLGEQKHLVNNIREIKRLLNENPENPDIAFPTSSSATEATTLPRDKRSVSIDSDPADHFVAPKIVSKSDERRKTKKFTSNGQSTKMALHAVSRTARNSVDENDATRRPFVAAHFHGNTSHLSPEIHQHYKGNGLVRVPHEAAHDVWYPSPWTLSSPHPRPTLTRNGHVHVHHTGVYLVYVQIYYLDSHDIISWVLHRTNPESEGRETLLQCAQSSHSAEPLEKPNSCFSAAALYLRAGDKLAVRNTGGDRHSLMQPEKSFIGLVKLADAEDPDQEL